MPSTQKLLVSVGLLSTLCVPAAFAEDTDSATVNTDTVTSPVQTAAHDRLRAARLLHKQRALARRIAEREQAAAARRIAAAGRAQAAKLRAIARCESGGNPRAIGAGGRFRGAYQFDRPTWAWLGGRGDPAAAPMAEQTRRAAVLYARVGSSAWGACG